MKRKNTKNRMQTKAKMEDNRAEARDFKLVTVQPLCGDIIAICRYDHTSSRDSQDAEYCSKCGNYCYGGYMVVLGSKPSMVHLKEENGDMVYSRMGDILICDDCASEDNPEKSVGREFVYELCRLYQKANDEMWLNFINQEEGEDA